MLADEIAAPTPAPTPAPTAAPTALAKPKPKVHAEEANLSAAQQMASFWGFKLAIVVIIHMCVWFCGKRVTWG